MRFLLVLLPLLVTAADPALRPRPTTWAQPVLGARTENCYKVSDDLYRSEQPDEAGMRELAAFGIKAVLNLRNWHSDQDEAAGTGIALFRVAMDAGDINDALMRKALDAIRAAPKPVLVHCWHGSDRTGAVVALYRMAEQGWDRESAIDEFKHGGYGYHETWYPNIERWLRQVDLAAFRKP
jgi:protein tyrosine/serine phosphatase